MLDNEIVYYNFTSLGNVTLRQPVEGSYLMALVQDCPSGMVLRMTYDVTFTSSKERVAAYIEVLMFYYHAATGSTSLPTGSTTASNNGKH